MLTLEKQREKPEGLRILMGWYQHLKLISSQAAEEGGDLNLRAHPVCPESGIQVCQT